MQHALMGQHDGSYANVMPGSAGLGQVQQLDNSQAQGNLLYGIGPGMQGMPGAAHMAQLDGVGGAHAFLYPNLAHLTAQAGMPMGRQGMQQVSQGYMPMVHPGMGMPMQDEIRTIFLTGERPAAPRSQLPAFSLHRCVLQPPAPPPCIVALFS